MTRRALVVRLVQVWCLTRWPLGQMERILQVETVALTGRGVWQPIKAGHSRGRQRGSSGEGGSSAA